MTPDAKSLKSVHRKLRRISALLRVWGNSCLYCGRPFSIHEPATVEHLIPQSLGGKTEPDNLAIAHERCNSIRGNASIIRALQIFEVVGGKKQRGRALHPHRTHACNLMNRLQAA